MGNLRRQIESTLENTQDNFNQEENVTKSKVNESKNQNEKKRFSSSEKKVTCSFQINESTRNLLEDYCKRNDMTLSEAIKKAIRDLLNI